MAIAEDRGPKLAQNEAICLTLPSRKELTATSDLVSYLPCSSPELQIHILTSELKILGHPKTLVPPLCASGSHPVTSTMERQAR